MKNNDLANQYNKVKLNGVIYSYYIKYYSDLQIIYIIEKLFLS